MVITPDALALEHGRAMLERAASYGAEVVKLKSNRLVGLTGEADERKAYALAKTTFAIVVSPPGARKLQPIPPSADWQFHVAQGCPAHCQYCYLAGSLSGAAGDAGVCESAGNSGWAAGLCRVRDGDFEVARAGRRGNDVRGSCYTDPLGIEHLTGALEETISFFAAWDAPVQLRFTTKFDAVDGLAGLVHHGRTRVRFSVNAAGVSRDFEGGTGECGAAPEGVAQDGFGGLPGGAYGGADHAVANWQEEYSALFLAVAEALSGVPDVDLTTELITHRFTPGSKQVLLGWYPKTTMDLREEARTEKRNKFGGFKYVYPKDSMAEMKQWFYEAIRQVLPMAKVLYWT